MSKRQRETMTAAPEVPYSPGAYTDPFDEAMDREEPSTPDPGNGQAEAAPAQRAPTASRTRQVTFPTLAAVRADQASLKAEMKRLKALERLLEKLDSQGLLPCIDPDKVAHDT